MRTTNIGEMRHRITIFSRSQIEETGGSGTYTQLNEIAILWSDIRSVSGLTRFDTKQIGTEITHRITIRYYQFISSQNWIKFGNRNFEIINVVNIGERNQYLQLMCKEVYIDVDPLQAGESVDSPLEG
jgi:SPP1 family predicted phage head-tail adaptor